MVCTVFETWKYFSLVILFDLMLVLFDITELIPKRRSLESWLEMTRDGSHMSTKVTIVRGLDRYGETHHSKWMSRMPAYEHETLAEQCINVH